MPLSREDVDRVIAQAILSLPGASTPGLKSKLYIVIKEFLQDSNAWTEVVELPINYGQRFYRLTTLEGGRPLRLIGVWDHKRFPVAAVLPKFDVIELVHPVRGAGNGNYGYISPIYPESWGPDAVNPNFPPSPYCYHAKVVKNIVAQTTENDLPLAPDFVLGVYDTHIIDGLIGNMMLEPKKTYSDQTTAAYHLKRFRTGIQMARTAALRENLVGGQAWSYPRGWQSTSQRGGMVSSFPDGGRW